MSDSDKATPTAATLADYRRRLLAASEAEQAVIEAAPPTYVGTLRRAVQDEATAAQREALLRAIAEMAGEPMPPFRPSIIDWEIKPSAQVIQQRIERLRARRVSGAAAQHFRNAHRRLRAARNARAHGDDVGQQQVLQGREGHFVVDEFFSHGAAPTGSDACEANPGGTIAHRLSGVSK